MPLRVSEQAFRSDTGRQRTANEDSYFARAPLFVVADGMGGAQAGEVASKIAADAFEAAERQGEAAEAFLRRVAEAANERIHALAKDDSTRSGMGTTLTAVTVDGSEVAIAHVGDSRAYVYRDGSLRLLTSDHSLVEELRRQGRLTEEQAADHPQRSIITRALGPESKVEVDTLSFSARPDDVFVLCSDGLTTMLGDERIAAALESSPTLDQAVDALVRAANEEGGRDNITVVAFRLEETEKIVEGDDATLIGPSAEEAGLSAERVRAAQRPRAEDRGTQPVGANRSRSRAAAKALVIMLLVAAVGFGAVYGIRQVYFLGIDEGGRVTLYRGLPYDLALGVSLYSEVYSTPVQASSVPVDRRDSLTNHDLRSRDDAVSLLDDLESASSAPANPSPNQNPATPGAGTGNGGEQPGGTQNGGSSGGAGSGGAEKPDSRAGSRRPPRSGDRTRGQSSSGQNGHG